MLEGYGLGSPGSGDSRVRPGEGVALRRGAQEQPRAGVATCGGFRVRGAGQPRVFASPSSAAALSAAAKEKVEA